MYKQNVVVHYQHGHQQREIFLDFHAAFFADTIYIHEAQDVLQLMYAH